MGGVRINRGKEGGGWKIKIKDNENKTMQTSFSGLETFPNTQCVGVGIRMSWLEKK